jgi:Tetracyclin repressor-like, C-terminal domain
MPIHDLAYLVIRIGESFIYTDLITGGNPDSGKARTALLALLS